MLTALMFQCRRAYHFLACYVTDGWTLSSSFLLQQWYGTLEQSTTCEKVIIEYIYQLQYPLDTGYVNILSFSLLPFSLYARSRITIPPPTLQHHPQRPRALVPILQLTMTLWMKTQYFRGRAEGSALVPPDSHRVLRIPRKRGLQGILRPRADPLRVRHAKVRSTYLYTLSQTTPV